MLDVVKNIKNYNVKEAVELLKQYRVEKKRNFVETVDIVFNLGIDSKQAEQSVRGSVALPAGSGKKVRVIVFTSDIEQQKESLAAGAALVGMEDLIEKIDKGFLDFDYCIATPDVMRTLSKVARKLGPRGLMPNTKNGNVTKDVVKALKEVLKGKINFKNDKYGIVHMGVGKVDFEVDQLVTNVNAVINAIKELKPESTKGKYMKSIFISTTMGPSVVIGTDKI